MSKLSKVKDFYDSGLWTKSMVSNAVAKDWITSTEYQEIIGETYTAPAVQPESGDLETRVETLESAINILVGGEA